VEAQGGPHPVLQAFAAHLRAHLLTPSGRGGDHRKARALSPSAGGYTGCAAAGGGLGSEGRRKKSQKTEGLLPK